MAYLYDKLMDKVLFSATLSDLNHINMIEEYRGFNKNLLIILKTEVEEENMIVINDSSLFFVPFLPSSF